MNYRQLQAALKTARNNGSVLTVKLNAKKEVLQAEYDRIMAEAESESSDYNEYNILDRQMTTTQEQAKHRVSIKRELRKLGYVNFNNEDTTEVLEAKLAEAKTSKTEKQKMSATEHLTKIAEIYNPIKKEVQKFVNNLTLQEKMRLCQDNDVHHLELVNFLAKQKAIPLWKQAGLA